MQRWLAETQALSQDISQSRGGSFIDVDGLLEADREELEARSGELSGRD
jgi:hypothetical protein